MDKFVPQHPGAETDSEEEDGGEIPSDKEKPLKNEVGSTAAEKQNEEETKSQEAVMEEMLDNMIENKNERKETADEDGNDEKMEVESNQE